MENSKASSIAKGKAFQVKAASILSEHFGVLLQTEQQINIGNPPKAHSFDLVSKDSSFVGECKDVAWTESGNVPSAKISTINEAVLYLQQLPSKVHRFVVMPRSNRKARNESLAAYYYRTYGHLLNGISVIEIDLDTELVHEF